MGRYINYLSTGNKVQLYLTELNILFFEGSEKTNNPRVDQGETFSRLIPNFNFIFLSHFLFLKLSSYKISSTRRFSTKTQNYTKATKATKSHRGSQRGTKSRKKPQRATKRYK